MVREQAEGRNATTACRKPRQRKEQEQNDLFAHTQAARTERVSFHFLSSLLTPPLNPFSLKKKRGVGRSPTFPPASPLLPFGRPCGMHQTRGTSASNPQEQSQTPHATLPKPLTSWCSPQPQPRTHYSSTFIFFAKPTRVCRRALN